MILHRSLPRLAIIAALGVVAPGLAAAMDSCAGTYSATLLSPLAAPTVVALNVSDSSDLTARLAKAFTAGMQDAGVTVAGTPTVSLRLSYSVVGQGGGSVPGGPLINPTSDAQTGWSSWAGGQTEALQGGITLALPDIPSADMFNPQTPTQSGLLMLRAEARNTDGQTASWIAVLQCTVQTLSLIHI